MTAVVKKRFSFTEAFKKYLPAALMMAAAVIPLITPEASWAGDVFSNISPLNLQSDTNTMGQNIAKFLALVRWVCLAVGVGLFFVAGVKYMKEDNHQQGMGALPKAAVGLFVIAIGLSVVNYYIGTFGLE